MMKKWQQLKADIEAVMYGTCCWKNKQSQNASQQILKSRWFYGTAF